MEDQNVTTVVQPPRLDIVRSPKDQTEFLEICEAIIRDDQDKLTLQLKENPEIWSKYLTLRVSDCPCGAMVVEHVIGTDVDGWAHLLKTGTCEHVDTLGYAFIDPVGIQLVHWLAAHGTAAMMEALLCSFPHLIDSPTLLHKLPPLAVAIIAGKANMVKCLIHSGAKLDLIVKVIDPLVLGNIVFFREEEAAYGIDVGLLTDGYTTEKPMLLYLIIRDLLTVDMLKCLLDNASLNLQAFDRRQRTALMHAIGNKNLKLVEALLVGGADPNFSNTGPEVVPPVLLHAVAVAGNDGSDHRTVAIIAALLKAGANPNFGSPIFEAIQSDSEEVVELLLKYGADVNICGEELGLPIIDAASRNQHRIVQLLIDYGADVNSLHADGSSYTPLLLAAMDGYRETTGVILATGLADVELELKDRKCTALNLAALRNKWNVLQRLVNHGCNVKTRDCCGNTPLHYSAMYGCTRSVAILLAAGADPDARNKNGVSPLWEAVQNGRLDICKTFLRYDVDLSVKSCGLRLTLGPGRCSYRCRVVYTKQQSILWMAVQQKNQELINLLLSCGLNVHGENWIHSDFEETGNGDPVIRENLIHLASGPPALQSLCRKRVLQMHGHTFSELSSGLGLPSAHFKLLKLF